MTADDRIEFCRDFVKMFKDFDKTVLSKNRSKIEALVRAAREGMTAVIYSPEHNIWN